MPVNTPNVEYEKYADQWRKCRDCIEGEEAVKAAGVRYLPPVSGQTAGDGRYEAYLKRALFFNAMSRTVQTLLGFLFRKPPILRPDGETEFFDSLTLTGNFNDFLRLISDEIISVGRVGILADADEAGRIKLISYRAEDIISWELRGSYEQARLTRAVLREAVSERDSQDEFLEKTGFRYRVLVLTDEGDYEQRVYEENPNDKSELILTETLTPRKNGDTFDYIPFAVINAGKPGFSVEKPVLIDLANVNLSHYRSSADLEQGRHYTALPTPWVAGFDPQQTELKIGAGVAWVSEKPDAKAGFLEFTGQGLKALENALAEKMALMAVLGARTLEPQKKAVEAADTYRIRGSGEQSVLAGVALNIENVVTELLRICWEWAGRGDPSGVSLEMNRDYAATEADASLVTTMFAALQGAAISEETWFWNLKKWELLAPGRTLEDEQAAIDARVPGLVNES